MATAVARRGDRSVAAGATGIIGDFRGTPLAVGGFLSNGHGTAAGEPAQDGPSGPRRRPAPLSGEFLPGETSGRSRALVRRQIGLRRDHRRPVPVRIRETSDIRLIRDIRGQINLKTGMKPQMHTDSHKCRWSPG